MYYILSCYFRIIFYSLGININDLRCKMHNCKLKKLLSCLLLAFAWCAPHFNLHGQPEQIRISTLADSGKIMEQIKLAVTIADSYTDSAQHLLNTLFQQSKRMGFIRGMQESLARLMQKQLGAQSYQNTITLADSLLKITDPDKNQYLIFYVYFHKARALENLSQHNAALNTYFKALNFITKENARDKPKIYLRIADMLNILSLPDKSIRYLDLAITSGYQYKRYSTVCNAYMGKSHLYRGKENYQKSKVSIDSAILITRIHKLDQMRRFALVYKAELQNDMNQFDAALITLEEAEKIPITDPNLNIGRCRIDKTRGDAYLASGKYDMARKAYEKALFTGKNGVGDSMHLLHRLSSVYALTHHYKKAYNMHLLAHSLESVQAKEKSSDRASELEVRYRVSEKNKEIALKNLKISHAEKDLAQKNLLIVSISLGTIILLMITLYLYRSYRKKKILAEKEKEITALRAMMEGEEQERKRLSRELHDGVGGMLAALKLKVNNLKKNNPDPALLHQIYDVIDMLQDTSSEVRTTAHNLLPDILTRLTLPEALAHYLESINRNGDIRIHLHIPYPIPPMEKPAELILYRIVQELVQNVLKHARASNIEIQLLQHNGELTLTVEDNGTGFDRTSSEGYGLDNLRYRVHALHGEMDIDTAPGESTTVRIAFNIEKFLSVTLA